jgi:hypothetical protein
MEFTIKSNCNTFKLLIKFSESRMNFLLKLCLYRFTFETHKHKYGFRFVCLISEETNFCHSFCYGDKFAQVFYRKS